MLRGLLGVPVKFSAARASFPTIARQLATEASTSAATTLPQPKQDKLFKAIEIEVRGHDKAVLLSYVTFLQNACEHLQLEKSEVQHIPFVKWIQNALRSKFAKKKYQLHYETRTHIKRMSVYHLTGSTASTFLEYIQRNIPEGVAMKVSYEELRFLPKAITDFSVNQ